MQVKRLLQQVRRDYSSVRHSVSEQIRPYQWSIGLKVGQLVEVQLQSLLKPAEKIWAGRGKKRTSLGHPTTIPPAITTTARVKTSTTTTTTTTHRTDRVIAAVHSAGSKYYAYYALAGRQLDS